ncbi:MAG: peptidoglycan editing factor PgeF [Lachnospiraceae bacterium]|nr:peptidoglycan editing factor PgeF [Lachnospiraceae bacterium]
MMIERFYNIDNNITLPLLVFPELEELPWLAHCFTTRGGGVSQGIYESLNLSFTRGDEKDAVLENYGRVAKAMGSHPERIVTSDQTHTTNVRLVTEADAGKGIVIPRDYADVDGLITQEPGLLLATFYADCVPLYFVDPVHRAIGLSHSGWRGTVERMGAVTILTMRDHFGTKPEDLLCAVGPSICQDCYEISQDVAVHFQDEFPSVIEEVLVDKGHGKYQLDLWKINQFILQEAGVPQNQIFMANMCTCCNSDRLFSHRATKGKRGNLGAFLMIRQK